MARSVVQEARRLASLKSAAAKAKERADNAKRLADEAEHNFYERLDAEGIDSIKVDGTNFVPAQTVFGQIQDAEEFIKWCEVNRPELIEPKARKALVNELVRDYLDTGQPLPPGLGFYVQEYVSRRVR